jgi:16S rRNA (guanine(966)-N(2))-methyltransferase RsmD
MRIIAGKAKGRVLVAPKAKVLRPTTDRVKESLFNILSVEGRQFLDLFAGAGSVGLEAASRGASRVLFVESNRSCAQAIRTNIERCGFLNMPPEGGAAPDIEVIECPAERALRLLGHRADRFDIVFADPPYGEGAADTALRLVRSLGLLSEGGVVVVQHSIRDGIPAQREGYRVEDSRRYGDTALSFLTLSKVPEDDAAQPGERDRPDG